MKGENDFRDFLSTTYGNIRSSCGKSAWHFMSAVQPYARRQRLSRSVVICRLLYLDGAWAGHHSLQTGQRVDCEREVSFESRTLQAIPETVRVQIARIRPGWHGWPNCYCNTHSAEAKANLAPQNGQSTQPANGTTWHKRCRHSMVQIPQFIGTWAATEVVSSSCRLAHPPYYHWLSG